MTNERACANTDALPSISELQTRATLLMEGFQAIDDLASFYPTQEPIIAVAVAFGEIARKLSDDLETMAK